MTWGWAGRSRCTRDAHISESRCGAPGSCADGGRLRVGKGKLSGSGEEGEDFCLGVRIGDAEEGAGDGEVEASGAGGAWVEVEDSVAVFDGGFVGVAIDDCGDAGGLGVEVEVVYGVEHVEEAAG